MNTNDNIEKIIKYIDKLKDGHKIVGANMYLSGYYTALKDVKEFIENIYDKYSPEPKVDVDDKDNTNAVTSTTIKKGLFSEEELEETRSAVKTAEELRPTLQCKTFPLGSFDKYKYVVICSYYEGRYMLSRHSKRTTWETQGGHIETGETPMEAAKRELYEESGVTDAEIIPVCDYIAWCDAGDSNGVVYAAVINTSGELPES